MKQLSIERALVGLIAVATLVLLWLQFSSLFVTPIHNSYLWWGDESWLMSEYRSQVTTGVFRHPHAYGSSLWIGNPFPFTAMWLTSAIYGFGALLLTSFGAVDAGRTITTFIAIALMLTFWWTSRYFKLSPLAVVAALALLISTRSYFLTSHSARYDIITSIVILVLVSILIRMHDGTDIKGYFLLGFLAGAGLLVSVHVPLLMLLPLIYFLYLQRAKPAQILSLVAGGIVSVGALYLIHFALQPTLFGETNLSENLRTIPILRPFSWSVQSNNLAQKWDLIISFAPQLLLVLLACIEGLRCPDLSRHMKQAIVLLMLPMLGWLLIEPAGPSSYLVHFLPGLALAAAIGIHSVLVGTWQRSVIAAIALATVGFGINDAVTAEKVGRELSDQHASAIAGKALLGDTPIIAMSPALSLFEFAQVGTTHFIELPSPKAEQLTGQGYLLTYNSSIVPGFMWEVLPLRQEVTSPELVLTGQFLDVGRSYFKPLDEREDTLFLQRVDLSALYRRHIR